MSKAEAGEALIQIEVETRVRVIGVAGDEVLDVIMKGQPIDLTLSTKEAGARQLTRLVAHQIETRKIKVQAELRGGIHVNVPAISHERTDWHPNMPAQVLRGMGRVLRGKSFFEPEFTLGRIDKGGQLWVRCPRCNVAAPGQHALVTTKINGVDVVHVFPSFVCPDRGCGAHYWARAEGVVVDPGKCPTCDHAEHAETCLVVTEFAQPCRCEHADFADHALKSAAKLQQIFGS